MTSQTWAAWLLDSYAASVTHVSAEHPEDIPYVEPTSATSTTSTTRSVSSGNSPMSPYGPYARIGRGGAGNFYWQTDTSTPQDDSEAQIFQQSSLSARRQAAAKLERIETGEATRSRKSNQYVHMGRGGAGNYTQSNDAQLARSPRVVSSPLYLGTPTVGRGGAGNMMLANEAKKKLMAEKEEIEREEAEKRRQEIAMQVEELIQMPKGAVVSHHRRSSSLDLA